ncbi:MAG: aminotransferase class V-fold PLP-dependent enzyme [Propionibacteriaceae bacterium]
MHTREFPSHFGPGVVGYFDTPSMGLPTAATVAAVEGALQDWFSGRARHGAWEESIERCRLGWAQLAGADPRWVGTASSVAAPLAAVLTALARRGGDVVAHVDEFQSLLLPAVAAFGQDRVRLVSGDYTAAAFAERLDSGVRAVVLCSVSSGTGARPDLESLVDAADAMDAAVVVDATQSEGIVGLGTPIARLATVVAAGYKGLLSPRGTGYVHAGADLDLAPFAAVSPYGVLDDAHRGPYGRASPHPGGRGLTQSPAWLAWVGAEPALDLLNADPAGEREEYVLDLARLLRTELQRAGIRTEPGELPSPVVSIPLIEPAPVTEALAAAGIRAAVRLGRLRLGLHRYTTRRDVDSVLETLTSTDLAHYERI